jgi:hypothetical protein
MEGNIYVNITCPKCGQQFRANKNIVARTGIVKCLACKSEFSVRLAKPPEQDVNDDASMSNTAPISPPVISPPADPALDHVESQPTVTSRGIIIGHDVIIASVGAILILIGIFLPIVESPLVTINMVRGGRGDGIWLALAAFASVLALTSDKYRKRFWLTSLLMVGILLLDFVAAVDRIRKAQAILQSNSDPMVGAISGLIAHNIRMGYGWAFLFLGAITIIAAPKIASMMKK